MTELKKFEFVVPTKKVTTPEMVQVWQDSEAYQEYLGFLKTIGDSIKGRKIREKMEVSKHCEQAIGLLSKIRKLADETPPQPNLATRYGNPAYREWAVKLQENAHNYLSQMFHIGDIEEEDKKESNENGDPPPKTETLSSSDSSDDDWAKHWPSRRLVDRAYLISSIPELLPYLLDSFGNATRIDYGTGHEMNFVMFVCALFKIGFLDKDEDCPTVGLKLFSAYFDLARYLQSRYRMEPAGSMGVWNLDDYQFVSFILGAAQLSEGARVKPKSISDPEISGMLKADSHFFACLAYIHEVKTGPFHEHSNQLWNISGVPYWQKVYTGLIKMYKAEVLCKFPVIQHSLFGSIFTLEKAEHVFKVPGDSGSKSHQLHHKGSVDSVGLGIGRMPPSRGSSVMEPIGAMPDVMGRIGDARIPRPGSLDSRVPGGIGSLHTSFPGKSIFKHKLGGGAADSLDREASLDSSPSIRNTAESLAFTSRPGAASPSAGLAAAKTELLAERSTSTSSSFTSESATKSQHNAPSD